MQINYLRSYAVGYGVWCEDFTPTLTLPLKGEGIFVQLRNYYYLWNIGRASVVWRRDFTFTLSLKGEEILQILSALSAVCKVRQGSRS